MTFTVYHKGKEIKDPSTGEVLDVQVAPLGQLTHHHGAGQDRYRQLQPVPVPGGG